MDLHHAYADLLRRVKDVAILNSCAPASGWDERTYMPHNGTAHRGNRWLC